MSWNWLAKPLLFSLSAEQAHYAAMNSFAIAARSPVSRSVIRKSFEYRDDRLGVQLLDLEFENPVGLAAGFDKNAAWFDVLPLLGFGHVEVGTITAESQPGNPKPRLFRLEQDSALLNRMGFNNNGCVAAKEALAKHAKHGIVGINIGKTKVVGLDQAVEDYLKSLTMLYPHADYFTVNVSSPNTPGLRELQNRDRLQELLSALATRNLELSTRFHVQPLPMLLKIAPDLTPEQLDEVIEVALEEKFSGIIATNTTISRKGLKTSDSQLSKLGDGGISGSPLTGRSRQFVRDVFRKTAGRIVVIGVGGIMNGEDAWRMICAGASLVQVYSGFVYAGPGFVKSINRYLVEKLDEHGLDSIQAAVGRDA